MIAATLKTLEVLTIILSVGARVFDHFCLRPTVTTPMRGAG